MWCRPLGLVVIGTLVGCQFPADSGSLRSPADRSAAAAISALDTDGNGVLDRREVKACPDLLNAWDLYDQDRDGYLTHQELVQRFRTFCRGRPPSKSVTFQVLLDDKPLVGADVRLEPEPFVAQYAKPALGLTDTMGLTSPRTPELGLGGVYCGLYRILISWKDADGREQLPPRYNIETTLGQEISPDLPPAIIVLRLSRR